MGRAIVKLAEDKYVEWSSVVDAPTTYVMTREAMKKYLDQNTFPQGTRTFSENEERLKRCDENVTSYRDYGKCESAADFIKGNRAGPKESELTLEEMLRDYDAANPAKYTQPA